MELKDAMKLVYDDLNRDGIIEFKFSRVVEYNWGWTIGWDTEPVLYGGSDYLVHKNGNMAHINKILWDNNLPIWDLNGAIKIFVKMNEGN